MSRTADIMRDTGVPYTVARAQADTEAALPPVRPDQLLARLVEYVDAVEDAVMQTELGRTAWPRYADRLRDAGDALKRECANAGREARTARAGKDS